MTPTVLIVEDNAVDQRAIETVIRDSLGDAVQVVHASTLSEARSVLLRSSVDCVLLDLMLPDSEGFNTVARLRAFNPHVPVVVLTGMDCEQTRLQAIAHGVVEHLDKDKLMSNLPAAIVSALDRGRSENVMYRQLDARISALNGLMMDISRDIGNWEKMSKALWGDGDVESGLVYRVARLERTLNISQKIAYAIAGSAGGGALTALGTWIVNSLLK